MRFGILAAAVLSVCSTFASSYLSPFALTVSKDQKQLLIAEYTAKQVVVFDPETARIARAIPLPLPPTGAVLSPDGATLYVTGESADGMVFAVDLGSGKVRRKFRVGHTPMAPVISPDGKTLYVCNRFNNNVAVLEIASGKTQAAIEVLREPVAAALTPDGKSLFVANHLPIGSADGDYISAAITVIDTAVRKAAARVQLPNGSTGLRGLCISADGKHVYVTHILARYHVPTTQLERGWMNTNALSIIDVAKNALINTVLLDDVDLGAANPWGVTCTADGKWICVAHAGTHEISVIDRAALHAKLDRVAKGEKVTSVSHTPEDVPNDLSFLVGVRRRRKLAGNGPRAVLAVDGLVYTTEYFTDSIGVVNVDPEVRHRPKSLPLGPKVPLTAVRKGEIFFHDASLCFQHWQSCASCHPDGRTDALNWDLLNDGMGNPKQTKSLLLSHKTPPVMVTGVRDKAETAVRSGIRFIQFAVRPEEDAEAIDAFLKSLKPVPSPYLVKGKLSKAAKRGKKMFKKAGCARCHPAPLYTDFVSYDVGLGRGLDKDRRFDTPTIIENWRTGPYLYDGRAATMAEAFTKHNPNDAHGKTSKLSPKQMADLVEFVLSQ